MCMYIQDPNSCTGRRRRIRRTSRRRFRRLSALGWPLPIDSLRLDQHGDHIACTHAKLSVLDRSQEGGDGSGVTSEGKESALVMGEDVVQQGFQTRFLRRVAFAQVGIPEGICFAEVAFKGVVWEGAVNVGFAAATVAGMDADSFTEELHLM